MDIAIGFVNYRLKSVRPIKNSDRYSCPPYLLLAFLLAFRIITAIIPSYAHDGRRESHLSLIMVVVNLISIVMRLKRFIYFLYLFLSLGSKWS